MKIEKSAVQDDFAYKKNGSKIRDCWEKRKCRGIYDY